MRRIIFFIFSFLLTATVHFVPVVLAASPRLTEVNFVKTSDSEEVIIFKLSEITIPKVFGIEGEKPRIVCDFLDVELANSVKRQFETKGDLIRSVRVGRHNAPTPMIRIVLDLIPGPDYDIQQTMLTEKKLFTINVNLAANKKDANRSPTD